MKTFRKFVFALLFGLYGVGLYAQNNAIELTGDILHLAIPGAAFASTIIWAEEKHSGTWEIIKAGTLSTVTTYGLKFLIDKQRPNGEQHAFPSGHASRAFTGAAFIQRKYGWEYGIPAYILAGYTGWTRVYSNNHDYWDVLGGAIVGVASAYIFTKPYQKSTTPHLSFGKQNNQYTLNFKYNF
jgi:membrane-associated phospholipid phosphatase